MLEHINQQVKQDSQEFATAFSGEYLSHRSLTLAATNGLVRVINIHRQNRIESNLDEKSELDDKVD